MNLNEITLSNNLNQIELEINQHKSIAGQSISLRDLQPSSSILTIMELEQNRGV